MTTCKHGPKDDARFCGAPVAIGPCVGDCLLSPGHSGDHSPAPAASPEAAAGSPPVGAPAVPAAEILRALQELADATHRLIGSLPLEDRGIEAGAANVKVRQARSLVERSRGGR